METKIETNIGVIKETKTIKCKSGNVYNIVNEIWENNGILGHKSTLLTSENVELVINKTRYINGVCELYRYQNSMKDLIKGALYLDFENFLTEYKNINNIKKLEKEQKEEIKKIWEEKEYTKDLMEIKKYIL